MNFILRHVDRWLLGKTMTVTSRAPYEIRSTARIARIYRDGKFVANCPNPDHAKALVDHYRRK